MVFNMYVFQKGYASCNVATCQAYSFEYQDGLRSEVDSYEYKWVARYFDCVNENTPIEEMIDFLVSCKTSLLAKGYHPPSLTELSLYFREHLFEQGIKLDERGFTKIYEQIAKQEEALISYSFTRAVHKNFSYKIRKIKDSDDTKEEAVISPKEVVGLLKCIPGGLLAVFPLFQLKL